MMDTGPATEPLAAEDLLQQLSRDLGLPDFMEEDASSSGRDIERVHSSSHESNAMEYGNSKTHCKKTCKKRGHDG